MLRQSFPRNQIPVNHLALVLHEDGNVHKHFVQLLDWLLQLDEHLVPVKVKQIGQQWLWTSKPCLSFHDRPNKAYCRDYATEPASPLLDVIDGRSQLILVSLNLDMPRQSRSSPSLEIIRGW